MDLGTPLIIAPCFVVAFAYLLFVSMIMSMVVFLFVSVFVRMVVFFFVSMIMPVVVVFGALIEMRQKTTLE